MPLPAALASLLAAALHLLSHHPVPAHPRAQHEAVAGRRSAGHGCEGSKGGKAGPTGLRRSYQHLPLPNTHNDCPPPPPLPAQLPASGGPPLSGQGTLPHSGAGHLGGHGRHGGAQPVQPGGCTARTGSSSPPACRPACTARLPAGTSVRQMQARARSDPPRRLPQIAQYNRGARRQFDVGCSLEVDSLTCITSAVAKAAASEGRRAGCALRRVSASWPPGLLPFPARSTGPVSSPPPPPPHSSPCHSRLVRGNAGFSAGVGADAAPRPAGPQTASLLPLQVRLPPAAAAGQGWGGGAGGLKRTRGLLPLCGRPAAVLLSGPPTPFNPLLLPQLPGVGHSLRALALLLPDCPAPRLPGLPPPPAGTPPSSSASRRASWAPCWWRCC
jgi:hypothetical protein